MEQAPRLDVQVLTPWADVSRLDEFQRRVLPWFSRGFYLGTGAGCNQRCRYCFLEKTGFAPWSEVAARVSLAQRLGYHHPLLIGGEPLVYPQLEDLLDLIAACGVEGWAAMTNGFVLADRSRVDHLVSRGAAFFHISFDSCRREVQDDLARNPGLFDALMGAFANLGRYPDIPVALGAVVTNANVDHLIEHVRFVASLRDSAGLRASLMFTQMKPSALADARLVVPMPKTALAIMQAVDEAERLGVHVGFRLLPLCLVPGYERFATDLWTQVMTTDAHGNLRQPPETETRKGEACNGCAVREKCRGFLRSYAAVYGEDEFRPVDVAVCR
jgi:MoaA/NifB/PqqE/SkfB family radical SAM enzyme